MLKDQIKIFQNRTLLFVVSFFATIGFMFGVTNVHAAWENPTQPPPNGNVAAPINVSSIHQLKEGGFSTAGTILGEDLFTVDVGETYIDGSKFHFNTLTGDALIRNDLKVEGTLTAANFFSDALEVDDIIVNKTLRVKDSVGVDDLFYVDGETNDRVYVGDDAGDNGMLQVNANGSSSPTGISVRNSDASNGAIFAENQLGAGIISTVDLSDFGAIKAEATAANSYGILGRATKGTTALSSPHLYSAGVRGEAEFYSPTTDEAMAGVIGYGKSIDNIAQDKTIRSFGVFGAGADIKNISGAGNHRSYGVYGSAGNITNGNTNTATYGVYGKGGTSGTTWAGYFNGDVNITGNLESTTITNSDSISTRALSATTQQGYGIEVEKTAGAPPDGLPAVKVTSANGVYEVLLGGAGQEADQYYALKAVGAIESVPPEEGFGDQKQIILDSMENGRNAYFRYSQTDSCVELWVPKKDQNNLIEGESPSILGEQWGEACLPNQACNGKCFEGGGFGGRECNDYGQYIDGDGKCPPHPGLNLDYICCKPGPPN